MSKADFSNEIVVEYWYKDEIILRIDNPCVWPNIRDSVGIGDEEYIVIDVLFYPIPQKLKIFLN